MESKIWKLLDEFEEIQLLKGLKEDSVKMKKRDIEKFFVYLEQNHPGKNYKSVIKDDILKYLENYETLFGVEIKSQWFNRKVSHLKEFYEFLLEKEEVIMNPAIPIEFLPVSKGDHLGLFTEEEIKRILSVIPDTPMGRRDRSIIELIYSTGLRLNELVNLDVEDMDFETREVFVKKGKFDKERILPVGDAALSVLGKYIEERHRWIKPRMERRALFLSAQGNRIGGALVQKAINKWKSKAGVTSKGVTHALRHSMASHMLKRGAPITLIKRILGHEHIETTQDYTHIHEEDLKDKHTLSHPKAEEEE